MMRIALFLLTNLAVIAIVGVIMAVLGVNTQSMGGLLIYCALFGFVGSFISLFLSKTMAKRAARVQMIEEPRSDQERWVYQTVKELSEKANIGMPEVGIFPAQEMNAFATGWNKNDALVAVSQGLLNKMTREEARAVIGHEIGHVANGDMVTLSLIQGVMNTFVFFFSILIANALSRGDEEGGRSLMYYPIQIGVQMILGIFASMIVAWFSRFREFRADEAGATLADKQSMINALKRLQGDLQPSAMPATMSAFAISGNFKELFSSHPPLEKRIAALQQAPTKTQA